MPKVLVTGSNGQLGQEWMSQFQERTDWQFIFTNKTELDITNYRAVTEFFQQGNFDFCVNTAAYTAVDKAESDESAAYAVNMEAVENLARVCAKHDIFLLHYSTDYVYHTTQNWPYQEDDPVAPKSIYGKSKLSGEQAALRINPRTAIIRTSWVFSSFGHNFVKSMLRLGKERQSLNVVFDQIGSPTYSLHLAISGMDILTYIHKNPEAVVRGVYNFSNEGVCSWYDFARAIFELSQTECQLNPIRSSQYPTPAKRPTYSVLDKAKIKETFSLSIPHWREGLEHCLIKLGELKK